MLQREENKGAGASTRLNEHGDITFYHQRVRGTRVGGVRARTHNANSPPVCRRYALAWPGSGATKQCAEPPPIRFAQA